MRLITSCVILVLMLVPAHAYYGEVPDERVGTVGGAFMKLRGGVRAAGMGSTFIAVADDPSAVYWNPAGLAQINTLTMSSMHTDWLEEISYTNLVVAQPFRRSTWGLSVNYINVGMIEETTLSDPAGTGRIFNPADYIFSASYAEKLTPDLYYGMNAKYMNENLDGDVVQGVALDFGLLAGFGSLRLGCNARNSLGGLGSDGLSRNFGFGIAYKFPSMVLAADVNMPNDNKSSLHMGAEYSINDILFLRTGVNSKASGGIAVGEGTGLGLRWKDMQFDYAYLPYGALGNAHLFSFSFRFGRKYKGELSEIRISPFVRRVWAGEKVELRARGLDERWEDVKIVPSWWVMGDIGTIEAEKGVFHAMRVGSGEVVVEAEGVMASVSIEVFRGLLRKIMVFPPEVGLGLGESLKFECMGQDEFGNRAEVSPAWETEGGIGEIDEKGVFTARATGEGLVRARLGNLAGTAEVRVVPVGPFPSPGIYPQGLLSPNPLERRVKTD